MSRDSKGSCGSVLKNVRVGAKFKMTGTENKEVYDRKSTELNDISAGSRALSSLTGLA